MSKFNIYAQKVDEIARKAFSEYNETADKLVQAEDTFKTFPQRQGGIENADALRAKANLVAAQERMRQVKRDMDAGNDTVSAIRRELSDALSDEYAARPEDVDAATMELLRADILTADEFGRLMNDAAEKGNHTMMRIIASHARISADKASEKYGEGDHEARALRVISAQGNADPASAKLQEFDALADIFRRTMRNTAMIPRWNELTAPIVENF